MANGKQIQDALELLEKEGYQVKLVNPRLHVGDYITHDRTGWRLYIISILPDGSFTGIADKTNCTCT